MAGVKSTAIPNFIKAGSPQGLRRLMLLNNARLKSFVNYFNISQYTDEKGQLTFIAWYFEEIESNDTLLKAGD